MLVLSRRAGESIVVGSDVVITVLEIRGEQIRLGIDAPRSITVHRKEVFDELARANQAAADSRGADLTMLPRPPAPNAGK